MDRVEVGRWYVGRGELSRVRLVGVCNSRVYITY